MLTCRAPIIFDTLAAVTLCSMFSLFYGADVYMFIDVDAADAMPT